MLDPATKNSLAWLLDDNSAAEEAIDLLRARHVKAYLAWQNHERQKTPASGEPEEAEVVETSPATETNMEPTEYEGEEVEMELAYNIIRNTKYNLPFMA